MEEAPVVRLNETSLLKLHEKLKKMKSPPASVDKDTSPDQGKEKKSKRTPKFGVYKAGVTRLSDRLVKSPADEKVQTESASSPKGQSPSEKQHRSPQASEGGKQQQPGKDRSKKPRPKQSSTTSDKKRDESESKKSLARGDDSGTSSRRQHRKLNSRRKSSGDYSRDLNEELEWDTYHDAKFLRSRDYDEKPKLLSDIMVSRCEDEEDGDDDDEWPGVTEPQELLRDKSADDTRSSKRTSDEPNSRKQLFDPSNPDMPIYVQASRRSRDDFSASRTSAEYMGMFDSNNPYTPTSVNLLHHPHQVRPAQARFNQPTYSSDLSPRSSYIPPQHATPPRTWKGPSPIVHDPVPPSYVQDDIISSHMNNIHRSSCVNLIGEAEKVDSFLTSHMSSIDFTQHSSIENLQKLRNKLKRIYESLILTDIELASKHNVDQCLWKSVYYQVIEKLREQMSSCTEDEKNELKNLLILILDQASAFYDTLLTSLQQNHSFNVKEMVRSVVSARNVNKQVGKRTKLAILTCQKVLICLGDVARYKEHANGTLNFGRARHFYIQARTIEPRNGRPYNQLAVLAVRTRRRLDAVYYYARSLATSGSPILSARESLISLFDDARRKLESIRRAKKSRDEKTSKDAATPTKMTSSSKRKEIWYLPDDKVPQQASHSRAPETVKTEAEKPLTENLTLSETMKQFILIFINIHGKLFTRVGFDMFEQRKEEALQMFKLILERSPIQISGQTLLHLFAINFFAVHEQQKKQGNSPESMCEHAARFTFAMIAVLTCCVTNIIRNSRREQGRIFDPIQVHDLRPLLPVVKLSCDWMYANRDLWYPVPPTIEKEQFYDVWTALAELCNWLCSDQLHLPVRLFSQSSAELVQVSLLEDQEFAGFAPLIKAENELRFVSENEFASPELQERASHCVRVVLIQDFLEYLCGMEQPLLAFKQGRYVVLVQSPPDVDEQLAGEEVTDDVVEDEVDEFESLSVEDNYEHSTEDDISHLRALRHTLQQTKQVHDKRKTQIQASLDEQAGGASFDVRPRYIFPDTNCFIDRLDLIQTLLRHGHYVVCVPLVVVSELEGLSHERKGRDEHSTSVHDSAGRAVRYLNEAFTSNRRLPLQAVTNEGSPLDTISFRSQQHTGNKATNDDLILQSCTRFQDRIWNRKDQVRTTVLLSDDRNLRVKALARSMPTKTLLEFCRWARIV